MFRLAGLTEAVKEGLALSNFLFMDYCIVRNGACGLADANRQDLHEEPCLRVLSLQSFSTHGMIPSPILAFDCWWRHASSF